MKIKIFLLTIFLLLTCGCSVTYNLEINNNGINETTEFISDDASEYSKDYLYSYYLDEYPIYYSEEFQYYSSRDKISGNTYYSKSIKDNEFGYVATYKANFKDIEDFSDSRMIQSSFGRINVSFNKDNNHYYINLHNVKILKEENISKIVVNITLPDNYYVIKSNASKSENNIHTWTLTDSENYINFEYCDKDNCKKEKTTYDNKEKIVKTNNNYFAIMMGVLVIILLFGLLILRKKEKENEK